MKYLYSHEETAGYREIVAPGNQTKHTGLGLIKLGPLAAFEGETRDREAVLVMLKGNCRAKVGGANFDHLARKEVFSGRATAVYVPRNSRYKITETSGREAEVAVLTAVAEKAYEPFVVRPEEVVVNHRGALNYQRDVHDIIVENGEGRVDRIVVGETFAYPGQWSSYPPHKHDTYNPPAESEMEEIYHFRIKPREGFAAQLIYTNDGSVREAYMVKDGDTVAIPAGYHPVAAAPGYQVYYLWVLSGNRGRQLMMNDDPSFAWINNVAPMLK